MFFFEKGPSSLISSKFEENKGFQAKSEHFLAHVFLALNHVFLRIYVVIRPK